MTTNETPDAEHLSEQAHAALERVEHDLAVLREERDQVNIDIRRLVGERNELRPVINAFDRAAKRRKKAAAS